MPRRHLLTNYVRFSGKKRTSLYISREEGDHYYIQGRVGENTGNEVVSDCAHAPSAYIP